VFAVSAPLVVDSFTDDVRDGYHSTIRVKQY
jgi:hypothetical protein